MTRIPSARAWVVALALTLLIGVLGVIAQYWLERTTQERLRQQLQTWLQSDVIALELWLEFQRGTAEIYGRDARVVRAANLLRELKQQNEAGDAAAALRASPALNDLRRLFEPIIAQQEYLGFALIEPGGTFLAGRYDALIGRQGVLDEGVLRRVLSGGTVISRPFSLPEGIAAGLPDLGAGRPVMFVAAPVWSADAATPLAALGFVIRPERDFARIFAGANPGRSGETIAFDGDGLLLSESRFSQELRAAGRLQSAEGPGSALRLILRDPGRDPQDTRLMHMVQRAVNGMSGTDLKGHADYRGVEAVGAWTWLPDLQIGVLAKQDAQEAYGVLTTLRRGLWILVGLLLLTSIALFAMSRATVHLRDRVREARQLGQYQLEAKIGEGGMGKVYRARHALLKRPTAIKLLKESDPSAASHARFEREVRSTAALSHPNTIAVYDYGHTPEGTFYYAMEYLQGITLEQCVAADGPQCEARVVYLMLQACGSIAEAHAAGLIHRDIKPSNIMICERGSLFDFVKVMDFGVVHRLDHPDVQGTNLEALTGTPHYLSPEAIRDPDRVDERSDIYQLGAIAYYLVTGLPVFEGNNIYEVCAHHLNTPPVPPSTRADITIGPDLEEVILRCLAKDKASRPASAQILLEALECCELDGRWGQPEARAWWRQWLQREN